MQNKPVAVRAAFVTTENINELLAEANVPPEFDLLSIDIDGNDYWIWQALTDYSPRAVIIEYNASFRPPRAWTMPYNPQHSWDGSNYYGVSLSALEKLGRQKGYRLVGCSSLGVNAFFVRADLVAGKFPNAEAGARYHYRPPRYNRLYFGHFPVESSYPARIRAYKPALARHYRTYAGLEAAAPLPPLIWHCYVWWRRHRGVGKSKYFGAPRAFFEWLNAPCPVQPSGEQQALITNLAYYIYLTRYDLFRSFPDLTGADGNSYAAWFSQNAKTVYKLPPVFAKRLQNEWYEAKLAKLQAAHDEIYALYTAKLAELETLSKWVADKEAANRTEITSLEGTLAEKDKYITSLDATLKEKDSYIESLQQHLQQIASLEGTLAEKNTYIESLQQHLQQKVAELDELKSWLAATLEQKDSELRTLHTAFAAQEQAARPDV
jgi:uncharacterized coiled-coil protein SlyX